MLLSLSGPISMATSSPSPLYIGRGEHIVVFMLAVASLLHGISNTVQRKQKV